MQSVMHVEPVQARRAAAGIPGNPSGAMTPQLYIEVKQHLLEHDPDAPRMLEWASREVAAPESASRLAFEIIWIILCAGRTAQSARTIERKVLGALATGRPVLEVFGHRMRAGAIERAWKEQTQDFQELQVALAAGPQAVIQWAGALPGVGEVTRYQLAKNFGCPVVKPDIWLCRFAGIAGGDRLPALARFGRCQALAEQIAAATGDSVSVIDSVLWLAGNKRLLEVDFSPHRITLRAVGARRGSIFGESN